MSEEQEITDVANKAIKDIFDGTNEEDSIRLAWNCAIIAASDIAMEVLATGRKIESISIVSVQGGLEVRFEIVETKPLRSIVIDGIITV